MKINKPLATLFLSALSASILASCSGTTNSKKISENSANQFANSLFTTAEVLSTVQSGILNEISGIDNSSLYNDCLWVNNDSGDNPNVYLINLSGELIATATLNGIENRDWEAIAIGGGYIYVGEIGDNNSIYPSKKIYRFKEPQNIDLTARDAKIEISDFETMTLNLENGNRDTETLMYDPISNNLVIVSKREDSMFVYEFAFKATKYDEIELVKAIDSTLNFSFATGGDFSEDGMQLLVKNYRNIFYWQRKSKEESLTDMLSRRGEIVPFAQEPQGEAVCWNSDGTAYYTISEKSHLETMPPIHIYRKK